MGDKVCPECGTRFGWCIKWHDDQRGEAYGWWDDCNYAWHDKDRDPSRWGE